MEELLKSPWVWIGTGLLVLVINFLKFDKIAASLKNWWKNLFKKEDKLVPPIVPVVPTPPGHDVDVTQAVHHFISLKKLCKSCPIEVQTALSIVWIHLEPGGHLDAHGPANINNL